MTTCLHTVVGTSTKLFILVSLLIKYVVNLDVIWGGDETCEGPCFNNVLIIKELYMFRTDLLSIISSLNTVYAAIGICHTSYVD